MTRLVQRERGAIGLAAFLYALALFYWFGNEDRSLAFVTALGAGGAILLAVHAALGARAEPPPAVVEYRWIARMAGRGLMGGLLAAPLTVSLMLMKISLHGHEMPDFTAQTLIGTLTRTPAWAAAGTVAGLGFGLIHLALRHAPVQNQSIRN